MKKNRYGTKNKIKPGQLWRAILEVIILSVISGGGLPTKPILPVMIKTICKLLKEIKKLEVEESKVRRVLSNLEKRKIVNLQEEGENVIVHLTEGENPLVLKYSIKSILDFKKKKKEWNGKWFLVFFDIPEIQRNKRDYLRKFLKKLGFYPYQKSVYLFPYECEEEINLIKKIVEGGRYMKYIIADKIEDEDVIKNFFKL